MPAEDYDMTIHQNPRADAWAKFFMETAKANNKNTGDFDEADMITWFANAMMAMHDHLTGEQPVVLPDGSAFVVASV